MGYLIYNKQTTRIVSKVYKTHAAAQAQLTRMRKNATDTWGILKPETDPVFLNGIAEEDYFHKHIEKSVERINLSTGKHYWEPVNTPAYLSPASESYWSM